MSPESALGFGDNDMHQIKESERGRRILFGDVL
jgi:hypothetical protein